MSHRLSCIYNCICVITDSMSCEFYTSRPAWVQYGGSIRVAHFAGPIKPWHHTSAAKNCSRAACQALLGSADDRRQTSRVSGMLAYWWSLFLVLVRPHFTADMYLGHISLEALRKQQEHHQQRHHHHQEQQHHHQQQHHEQQYYAPYYPSFVQGFWQPDNWVHQRSSSPPPHQHYHPEFHDTRWDHLHRGQRLDETNRFVGHHEAYPRPPSPQYFENHHHHHHQQQQQQQNHSHNESVNHHNESGYSTIHTHKAQQDMEQNSPGQDHRGSEQNTIHHGNSNQSNSKHQMPHESPRKREIKPFPYSSDCTKCHEELGREHDSLAYPFNKHKQEDSAIKHANHKPKKHDRKPLPKPKIKRLPMTNGFGVPKYSPFVPFNFEKLVKPGVKTTLTTTATTSMFETFQTKPALLNALNGSGSFATNFKRQDALFGREFKRLDSGTQLSPTSRGLNLFIKSTTLWDDTNRLKYNKLIESLYLEGLKPNRFAESHLLHVSPATKFRSKRLITPLPESKPIPLSADSGASDLTGSTLSATFRKLESSVYSNDYYEQTDKRIKKDHILNPVYYGFNSTIIHIPRRSRRIRAQQRRAREIEREKLFDKQVVDATWESKAKIDEIQKEIAQLGSHHSANKGGMAGHLANLDVGSHQLCNRHTQIEAANVERMYAWERGEIDYTGSDRFANILNKLCNTLRKTGDRNLPIGLDIARR